MSTKSLKIDSLDLDLENPRIMQATDQRDAMQKILAEQKVKLVNLAESIAVRGFSPMDRCLVLRSHLRANKFIVLEGNRRVLCAKLLKNPALLTTLEMPDSFRKRLLKAANGFDVRKIEPVDCSEVRDRSEGNDWIRRRHQGEDSGRGIVAWSSIAGARFSGGNPALQALDFVLLHGDLSEEEADLIEAGLPLSTLDRLLSTPSVRAAIWLEINQGKLESELPPEEILKPLKRIILDLSDKSIINVTSLKSRDQQNTYIGKLKAADKPNLSMKRGKSQTVEALTEKDFTVKPTPPVKKGPIVRRAPRHTVVPKSCKLSIPTAKIEGIYNELRSLQISKHVHAISVLMRVFLEMSVDDYLENKAGSKLTFKDPKNGHTMDRRLKDKVKETIEHLVASGTPEKELRGVKVAMKSIAS